jgi:hypothetical protein
MRSYNFLLGACLSWALVIGQAAQAAAIYAAGYSSEKLYRIDTQTGTVTEVGAFGINFDEGDLAFNAAGALYGAFAGTLDELATVNTSSALATVVGPFNPSSATDISATSFRPGDDVLFALDSDANKLVTINTTTGLASPFGTGTITGLPDIANVAGMAFDPNNADTLYMAHGASTSLYRIQNIASGTPTATIAGDIGLSRVTGMTFALDGSQVKLFVINSDSTGSQLYSVDLNSLALTPVTVNNLPASIGGIAAVVPEPGALSLLVAGGAAVLLRRARAAMKTR